MNPPKAAFCLDSASRAHAGFLREMCFAHRSARTRVLQAPGVLVILFLAFAGYRQAVRRTDVHARLLIPSDEIDADRVLEWWHYLAPTPGRVLGLSPFGDWFFLREDGGVWRLDILEGSFDRLTTSDAEFWKALRTDRALDEWLQAGHVFALERRGHLRKPGECYAYRVHPRLGGAISLDNMRLTPLSAWQLFCAQIHPQLDAMPPDAVFLGLRCAPDGNITIDWERKR